MPTPTRALHDLFARFQQHLVAVGGEAHDVDSLAQAVEIIVAHPALATGQLVVPPNFAQHPAWGPVLTMLGEKGITIREAEGPAGVADAPAGLSSAELAVAETGSVLLADNSLETRIVSMLTLTHFVLVSADMLVPMLDDAGMLLQQLTCPGKDQQHYISLITGPSRTADIERTLTIGVQGPKTLCVLVVQHIENKQLGDAVGSMDTMVTASRVTDAGATEAGATARVAPTIHDARDVQGTTVYGGGDREGRPGHGRADMVAYEEQPFEKRLEYALADENMHGALERFAPSWRVSRGAVFAVEEADYGPEYSFANLRSTLRQAKDYAIEHQPELIAQFKAQAEAAGAIVYEARTAGDANDYIYELCRRKGIELVVKSKTMVSEETELNHYLEARGVTAVETDLGEWVAQLAHERPSHMVMPIIHKTRQQVGALLSEAVGREISREDVAEQVAVIRVEHRKSFLNAGMGISGANALIAENGTVMMMTNEGNGRLVTSLPSVHVVMAGYDKLIGTYAEAMTQLRLLARSATAQHITSYNTFITGPTPTQVGKEMHIVLVDNGRSRMREDVRFKDALRCIRCAACANICPPYQQVGGHAFGYIYSGAIGLVVTPFHHGIEAGAGPQSLCVSCNACETVCPVEIPLPSLILDVRQRTVEAKGLPWLKKVVFGTIAHPALFDLATRFASIAQLPITRGESYVRSRSFGLLGKLPGIRSLAGLTRWRSLPAFAIKPLRDRVKSGAVRRSWDGAVQPTMTVCYFAGCMTDRLYPEMGEAVMKVLSACGIRVTFPRQQNCCGLLALNSGDRRHGAAMAYQTIAMLERALQESHADYILSASTSCVATIVQDYIKLFEDLHTQDWLSRAQVLAQKVIDFTSFMERVVLAKGNGVAPLAGARLAGTNSAPTNDIVVTYHDSCQSCNCLGLRSEARHIIQEVLGLELREMPNSDVCCGFGGSTSIEHPEVAERLLNNKLKNAESTGATVIVADNPGCLMHLRGGVDASGRHIRVLHLAQLMAERLGYRV